MCSQCRSIASGPVLYSGHNRWSKIRHEKGSADLKKAQARTQITKTLTAVTKYEGKESPKLANAVAAAKKAGVPKAVIEGAIARGLGISASGAKLESLTVGAMMPPSVALIVDVETDNKARSLQNVNDILKKHRTSATSTNYLFARAGRVVFERKEKVGLEEVMDDAIEAGAADVEVDGDGNFVLWTDPKETAQVLKEVGSKFDLETLSAGIVWSAVDDTVASVSSPSDGVRLGSMLAALKELPEVQAIYSNVSRGDLDEETWGQIEENLDAVRVPREPSV